MKKNDGGPAFPGPLIDGGSEPGMSLRDWFAGMAMQGFLAGWPHGAVPSDVETAECAYDYADAMLAERIKGE